MDGRRGTGQESGVTGLAHTVRREKGRTRDGSVAKETEAGCRFTLEGWEKGGGRHYEGLILLFSLQGRVELALKVKCELGHGRGHGVFKHGTLYAGITRFFGSLLSHLKNGIDNTFPS